MKLTDGHGVQIVELHAAQPAAGHEVGVLQHAEVLHDTETRHPRQHRAQLDERLRVPLEEAVEEVAAPRVGERPKDVVHGGH